jgi:hypothetical protein
MYASDAGRIVINLKGLGLWCLTPLSTIFQLHLFSLVEEAVVTGKLYHILFYRQHLA